VKSRYSFLVLLLFMLMGCGTTKMVVMLDGAPLPEYAVVMRNPATGLSIEVVAAKYVDADEEGEPILWPVYFGVDETYYVDPDSTRYIKITVKVRNPNKAWYELTERCSQAPVIGRGKTNISTKGIYKGRLRYNKFDIFYFTANNTERKHSIEVKDKGGMSIIRIGTFSYKVIRPNPEK